MSTDLASKALLAHLSVSVLGTGRTDRQITKDTNAQYNAAEDAGRFTKTLINKEYLKPIKSIVSDARAYHKDNTLPWQDRGGRLLPAKKHTDYMTTMRKYKQDFEAAMNEFMSKYDQAITDAQQYLGQMFDLTDYPSKMDISQKFKFEVTIDPVPTEDDFRTSLSDNEINQLKTELVNREKSRQEKALKDIKDRIIGVLEPFVEKLSDPESRVYEAYIANAVQLVDILPALNLNNDSQIDSICQDIKTKLCSFTVDDLRQNENAKKEASKQAKDIMDAYNLSGSTGEQG